jgi:hypothetical protein
MFPDLEYSYIYRQKHPYILSIYGPSHIPRPPLGLTCGSLNMNSILDLAWEIKLTENYKIGKLRRLLGYKLF